jgi:hypothetical protein
MKGASIMPPKLPIHYSVGDLFSSSDRECKSFCVKQVDTKLIKDFVKNTSPQKEKCLSYIGLSGANLTDLRNWGQFIEKAVSVEYCTNVYHDQIRSRFSKDIETQFQDPSKLLIAQGDIDDLLDPANACGLKRNKVFNEYLPFTLMNLDYYGTVISASKTGIMKRIQLLGNLFDLQRDLNPELKYLILLTVYHAGKDKTPDTEESQLINKIDEYAKRTKYQKKADEVTKSGDRIPVLALGVPLFIAEAAKSAHSSMRVLKRVTYRDTSYHMVHFALEMECKKAQSPPIEMDSIFGDPIISEIEKNGSTIKLKEQI